MTRHGANEPQVYRLRRGRSNHYAIAPIGFLRWNPGTFVWRGIINMKNALQLKIFTTMRNHLSESLNIIDQFRQAVVGNNVIVTNRF